MYIRYGTLISVVNTREKVMTFLRYPLRLLCNISRRESGARDTGQ